jgi:hypothetical protein
MGSDPPLRNALFATRAVSSGTSGHGLGRIDMMTRFCGREREQGKTPATADDHDRRHIRHPSHRAACRGIRQQDLAWPPLWLLRVPLDGEPPRLVRFAGRPSGLPRLGWEVDQCWAFLRWLRMLAGVPA